MKMGTKLLVAAAIGAITSGIAVASYYERDKFRSTITIRDGEVEDIHLWGSQTSKGYIKKKLPKEVEIAKKLYEDNKEEFKDGLTMYLE